MMDFELLDQKYVVQEKQGVIPHFYLWEKSDWLESFKGKISLKEAVEKAVNNEITFFAMPESKHLQTFVDTEAVNSALGLETIDQLSLYVQAKMDNRSEPFGWDETTPKNLAASRKLLNEVLGLVNSESSGIQKQNYEKWFSELL